LEGVHEERQLLIKTKWKEEKTTLYDRDGFWRQGEGIGLRSLMDAVQSVARRLIWYIFAIYIIITNPISPENVASLRQF
jgi:hypothetical protein